MSLKKMTLGSMAMASVGVLRILAQLCVLPVLARFLSPSDYGIIAIAMPFVLFAMMFSDAGISASLIRAHKIDMQEWSSCFWLVMGLGTTLAAIVSIIGFGVSLFVAEPIVFPIIAVLSLAIVLQSIATVPGASLQQTNKFSTIAIIEIIAMLVSVASTFLAARAGWGAWALVAQQLSHYTTKVLLTLPAAGFRPSLYFNRSLIAHHLKFGRDLVGNNLVGFVRQSLTNTIMGRVLGTAALGNFSMASLLSDLPNRVVSGPIQLVLYPQLARFQDDPHAMRVALLFTTRVIAMVVLPAFTLLAVAHSPVFAIVLSEKWEAAGYLFMILAPAAAINTVTTLRFTVVMALGRTDIMLRQSMEIAVMTLLALAALVHIGAEAFACSTVVIAIAYLPRSLRGILKLIDLPMATYLRTCTIPLLTSMGAACAYLLVDTTLHLGNLSLFFIAILCGSAAVASALALQFGTLKQQSLILQQQMSKPTPATSVDTQANLAMIEAQEI